VRGKVCPLPLFYTKRKVEGMKIGEVLEVIADDLTAKSTIPQWSKMHDHEVISMEDKGDFFRIVIKKH